MTQSLLSLWEEACFAAIEDASRAPNSELPEFMLQAAADLLARARILNGVACPRCHGRGEVSYGSTAGWRGGMGGAAITQDTCDVCWGTGRTVKIGPDLRAMQRRISWLEQIASERWLAERIGAEMATVKPHLALIADKLERARWGKAEFWLARSVDRIVDALREMSKPSETSP